MKTSAGVHHRSPSSTGVHPFRENYLYCSSPSGCVRQRFPWMLRACCTTADTVSGWSVAVILWAYGGAHRREPSALALRQAFPTPAAIATATASLSALQAARRGRFPSDEKLIALQ